MRMRAASAADAAPIAALINIFIRETTISFTTREKTPAEIAEEIAARQQAGLPWIVAEGKDAVAGYVTAAPFRKGDGYAKTLEHSLFVSPEAQNIGVGRMLMDALETAAIARGAMSLVAGISAENESALGFHQHLGFVPVGRIERAGVKFGRQIDLVLLQKHLSSPSDRG
ncbi:MAG: N-acetyltransferase family protein [Pseudomonadota bacterium]